jgi:dipeptidyl aminopeptidase/acylaminoacyl peptidase
MGVAAAGRALAVTAAIVVMAGCGSPARYGTGPAVAVLPASVHGAEGASRMLGGELAFVAHNRLFLAGGRAGRLRQVSLPGIPFAPAWSADRRWLAVEVSKPPPVSQPYAYEPAMLWLVGAAGTGARQLTSSSWDVTSFAWSPRASRLAAVAYLARASWNRWYIVATVSLSGAGRILTAGHYVSSVAWAANGGRIAADVGLSRGGRWLGRLESLDPAGGPSAVVTTSKGNTLELAGWWPHGSGLLYWLDVQGSASLAADGAPLETVGFAGRPPRQLTVMLVHGSWLAFAEGGRSLAAVSGGDRVIWSGGKHIVICRPARRCAAVAQPAGVVSVDPSWSPAGKLLVFARLSASGPFGPNGHADFSPYWIRRWEATSTLWLAGAPGGTPRPLTAAGPGAVDPQWGSDGSVLFVRDDEVWLLRPGARAAARPTSGPTTPTFPTRSSSRGPWPGPRAPRAAPERQAAAGLQLANAPSRPRVLTLRDIWLMR